MNEVLYKTDEIIESIDNDKLVVELKKLKNQMNEDEEIKNLIEKFTIEKNKYETSHIITDALQNAKQDLYNNEIVTKYRNLYSKLNQSIIIFNKDLNDLIKNKTHNCHW